MAIKAIINNTEKEIEQIKNSDEQDIDYVYSQIDGIEVEGEPPISIKSVGGSFADYHIYGNTVNGESVGDKTANLFDMSDYNPDSVTANEDGSFYIRWDPGIWAFSCKVETGKTYFLSWEELNKFQNGSHLSIATKAGYHKGYSQPCYKITLKGSPPNVWSKQYVVFTATDDYLSIDGMDTYIRNIMLVEGSTAMNYEPYGFKIPVTLTADNAKTTDIYLDAPLAKSGDIADYIDYAAQKRYNADGTESTVILPEIAVAAGTNTLSVETTIQPSNVYIKDNFYYKKVFTATRVIEDELSLNYKSIEDSDSTLKNYRIYGNTETKTHSYSGSAPLSFPIVNGAVSNYRIYGNTVNGNSVGNKTANLLNIFRTRQQGDFVDHCDTSKYIYGGAASNTYILPQHLRSASINSDGTIEVNSAIGGYGLGFIISANPDTTYTLNFNCDKVMAPDTTYTYAGLNFFKNNYTLMSKYTTIKNLPYTFTTPSEATYVYIVFRVNPDYGNATYSNIMLNEGDIALPYEPYGYKIPITITADSAKTTDIYLDEPLAKSGDIADYIDYAEQKRYNADGTSKDVSLPVLPAQSLTNSFSVGTEAQPSNITVDVDELVSVGDKTTNLFDMSDYNPNNVTANDDGSFYIMNAGKWAFSCKVETGKTYFLSWEELNKKQNNEWLSIAARAGYHVGYSQPFYIYTLKNSPPNVWYKRRSSFTAKDDYLSIDGMGTYIRNIMLVEGSTAMDYEPYGYKIPITITADSAKTTDIYLDEPLAKSGNNADYIDYATQKLYNSDGTESNVTLPALPTFAGTNTLSVGTEIEPSNIYIKGKIKSLD